MNRRGFLRCAASVALAVSSLAKGVSAFAVPSLPPTYPAPGVRASEQGLREAIEALFPAGVVDPVEMAYKEFVPSILYPIGFDTEYGRMGICGSDVQRAVHRTFKFDYEVVDDERQNERLRRAMYASMYDTFRQMSERPENAGAVLVWRVQPREERENDFEDDVRVCALRVRASLRQTGWRERLGVEPVYINVMLEGGRVTMLGAA